MTFEHDPYAAGVGFAVKLDKGDFIGRDALLRRKESQLIAAGTVTSTGIGEVLVEALAAAVAGRHAAVVGVSANRTVLVLSGAAARAVLKKGCPVDLHPREFSQGKAVTTTLARVPLLLWHAGPDSYRLLPRSSFAQYVARGCSMPCRSSHPASPTAEVPDGAVRAPGRGLPIHEWTETEEPTRLRWRSQALSPRAGA